MTSDSDDARLARDLLRLLGRAGAAHHPAVGEHLLCALEALSDSGPTCAELRDRAYLAIGSEPARRIRHRRVSANSTATATMNSSAASSKRLTFGPQELERVAAQVAEPAHQRRPQGRAPAG
jgi:hypothetical protein